MKSLHLATLALLAAAVAPDAAAQETPPKAPDPQGKPGAQAPEAAPKVDPVTQLKQSLEQAKKEKAYLERVKESGGLVARFLQSRSHAVEMRKKFAAAAPDPAQPTKKKARLLGDSEKDQLEADIVFTVESVPVRQAELDARVRYLESFPRADNTTDAKSLAIAALVRAKAGEGMFRAEAARARAQIEALAKELAGGASFTDLAKAHSDDKETAAAGGKRDFLVRTGIDANYAQAAFGLNVGQVSGVVATPEGFHLIRLLGKKKGATADQDQVQTSHILKRLPAGVQARLESGAVDVAFRSDDLRKLAPTVYK